MEQIILLILLLFFTCNVNNKNTYLFYYTLMIIILNIVYKNTLWKYLSITVMFGGLFIMNYSRLYFHNLLKNRYLDKDIDLLLKLLDVFLHIILPLYFINSIKKAISKKDFLNGIIIITTYITLINTKKYYDMNKESCLILGIGFWSLIYFIFKQ